MKFRSTARLSLPFASAIFAAIFTAPSIQAQTVRTWNGTTGAAWLTTSGWSPSGTFAGNAPSAVVTGEGATTDIMAVAAANAATNVGINMGTLSGLLSMGGIDFNKTNTATLQIGNSSSTNGILQLHGATINAVPKTLIRVTGSANLTIANVNSGSGTQTMGLRLGITDGIFDVDTSRTLTISSIISQVTANSGFTKTGAGTLTLSGANTYSGTTTISSGTLLATTASALPGYNAASKVSVASGATLAVRGAASGAWTSAELDALLGATPAAFASGSILGVDVASAGSFSYANNIGATQAAKGLTKSGDGTLTLSFANTYTGQTSVRAGFLNVDNNLALGTSAGDTVATSGTVALANGIIVTGESITIGAGNSDAFGALRTQSGANAEWAGKVILDASARLGAMSGTTLTVSGILENGAASGLAISGQSGTGTVLISGTNNTYTGTSSIFRGFLKIGATNALPTTTVLDVDAGSAAEDSTFDLNGFDQTVAGIQRTNNGAGTGGSIVTNSAGGTAKTLTLNLSVANSFNGNITGNLALTKSNTGTLTLSGTNTFTGATIVEAGTLSLGSVGSLQGTSGITLGGASGATLSSGLTGITITAPITTANSGVTSTIAFGINSGSAAAIDLDGAIGGNGNVSFTTTTVGGSVGNLQSIRLGAASTYAGTTTIGAANINVAMSVVNDSLAPNVLPVSTVLSFGNTAGSGSGRANTFNLNGQNQTLAGLNFTGALASDRNQRVSSTAAATLTIDGSSDSSFGGATIETPGNTLTSAQITGAIALTKSGSGTFTLGGTLTNGATPQGNTFTGDTKITGGILVLGEFNSIKDSAFDTASIAGDATNGLRATPTTLTLGGLTGGNDFSSRFTTTTGGYTGLTALTLNPGTGVTHTYSGDVGNGAGAMTLTKTGAGTQVLSAANTHSGATTVSAGILELGHSSSLQNSAFNTSSIVGDTTNGLRAGVTTLTMGGLTGSNDFSTRFTTTTGGYTGLTALTLNPGTGVTHTYSGDIGDGATGMTLTKTGLGTQVLSGTNTHTGATTVSAGTLILDGSTAAASAVSVGASGTLAGTGTINGTLDVTGVLSPGTGLGNIQTLDAGTTTWNGGSIWNFDLSSSSTDSDLLNITGDFNKGSAGAYEFNFMGSTPVWNTTYTLADWSGATSFDISDFTFTGLGAGPYGASSFAFNGTSLTFTAVPEPTSALAGLLIAAGLLRRRRK